MEVHPHVAWITGEQMGRLVQARNGLGEEGWCLFQLA